MVSTICFILSAFPEFNEDYDDGNIHNKGLKDGVADVRQHINGTFNGRGNTIINNQITLK